MAEERLRQRMQQWLEQQAADPSLDTAGRGPACLSFGEAMHLAQAGPGSPREARRREHVSGCEYCRRLVDAFVRVLSEAAPDAAILSTERRGRMDTDSVWDKLESSLSRLKEAISLQLPAEGGLSFEPVVAAAGAPSRLRRRAATAQGEAGDEFVAEAQLDMPEIEGTLEIRFVRLGAASEVSLLLRSMHRAGDVRINFRTHTGQEVRAAWLMPGDEVCIPQVPGGNYVIRVHDRAQVVTYEIPLMVLPT